MKRCHYRIYAINLPRDLREQISVLHAAAILKDGNKDGQVQNHPDKINKLSRAPK
jgi:hypothetical protein